MVVITTAGRTTKALMEQAQKIADDYSLRYVPRKKRSIQALFECYRCDIYSIGAEKNEIHILKTGETLQFHPNISMIRSKRFLRGESDRLIEAADIKEGTTILDCTMGLASDSIVMSLAAGKSGYIESLESNFIIHMMVSEGLQQYTGTEVEFNQAMRRIKTLYRDYNTYLKELPDNFFDVVYFDPMFHESFDKSKGLHRLKGLLNHESLSKESVTEAVRVARKRVVLKDHYRSKQFEYLGFKQHINKTSRVHYGVIHTCVEC